MQVSPIKEETDADADEADNSADKCQPQPVPVDLTAEESLIGIANTRPLSSSLDRHTRGSLQNYMSSRIGAGGAAAAGGGGGAVGRWRLGSGGGGSGSTASASTMLTSRDNEWVRLKDRRASFGFTAPEHPEQPYTLTDPTAARGNSPPKGPQAVHGSIRHNEHRGANGTATTAAPAATVVVSEEEARRERERRFIALYKQKYSVNPFKKDLGKSYFSNRTHNRRRWSHVYPGGIERLI